MLPRLITSRFGKLLRTCTAFAVSLLTLNAASQTPAQKVTINAAITIVQSARESGPVRRATKDLQSDFTKVFGQAPKVLSSLDEAGPVAILIAQNANVPSGVECATASDTEAFAFSLTGSGVGPTRRRVVCLTGADMRGTIFAIYEFSQKILGVDPMYLWTDKQPAKRTSIPLPSDFAHVYPSPVFKYRGFFPNDEDLLSGYIPGSRAEHTGISLKVWDQVFETILRLKGNMIVPGTWIFPDDAQVEAASERGLIVNQHHAIPLGVNVARWPRDVPYNFSTHPEILKRAWTNAVATYKPGEEILWSVGLRGLSDSSYASLDPTVRDNDPLLGQRVSDAIAEQMKIVRAKYPNAQFVTDLWQEGARLMMKGYLKIPPEVSLVWADTGYGDMQDGGKVAAGQGAYFHVAMMNGQANQLSEMVPVAIIQSELGRYIKAGATSYLLVNTSDLAPSGHDDARADGSGVGRSAGGSNRRRRRLLSQMGNGGVWREVCRCTGQGLQGVFCGAFVARRRSVRRGLTSAGNAPPAPVNFSKIPRVDGDQHYHSEIRRLILDKLSEGQVAAVPEPVAEVDAAAP